MRQVALMVHNVRSAHNVGSLLRTADGLGVERVYLAGYTPYPLSGSDERLPHIAARVTKQIHKTALGAEDSVGWTRINDTAKCLKALKSRGYTVAVLEQTPEAIELSQSESAEKIVLVVGNEISGVDGSILEAADVHLQIPMRGQKESFNVAVAAAIALYHLTGVDK
jgi:23S rRNA (guanosine2251-2'-O)-methyltransferase